MTGFVEHPTRRLFLQWVCAACSCTAFPAQAEPIFTASTDLVSEHAILTLLAIAQPADVPGLVQLATEAFDRSDAPNPAAFEAILARLISNGLVLRVRLDPASLFAVTALGQASLPPEDRPLRDRARLFLLRGRARIPVGFSRDRDVRTVGVPPAGWLRIRTHSLHNIAGWNIADYWSGNRRRPREALPPFLSFDSLEQISTALGNYNPLARLSYQAFLLCLGLSPQLMDWLIEHPGRCYRDFTIPKRRGGFRSIESPRMFLKTVQRIILHLIFCKLRVHGSVHSFQCGRSAVSNALVHERQRLVGGLDIKNFFGSVTVEMVVTSLISNDFEPELAFKLAQLCTRRGLLPQGAPTSPALSNALLYPFDEMMAATCTASNLLYTRYADDVTVSGSDRAAVTSVLARAGSELLSRYGFRLNESKTRVVGQHAQQRVTGAVVNVSAAPPRALRRRLRVIFHEASKDPSILAAQAERLKGYISYLQAFPSMRGSKALDQYHALQQRFLC